MEDKDKAKLKKEKLQPHPREKSNCLSHLFFCWELPIFVQGWKKVLNEHDLFASLKQHESKDLGDKLEKAWFEEVHFCKNPSLWRALIKLFAVEFLIYGLIYFPLEIGSCILQPHFLIKLLKYYTPDQKEITLKQAYIYAGALSATCVLRVLITHLFYLETSALGMKVRVACSSLIYRASLKLKKHSFEKFTIGRIVNLLSNDVNRFDQVFTYFHFFWIGPVEVIIGIYYADTTLGHAAVSGFLIIIACLLLQSILVRKIAITRTEVAKKTDQRINLMNDIIYGVQVIKMYTWEKPFVILVELARKLEIRNLTLANQFRLFINTFKIYMSKVCIFLSILAAVVTDLPLTSEYVFGLNILYENLKMACIVYIPFAVIFFSETIISVKRIEEFLLHDYEKPTITIKSVHVDICAMKYNNIKQSLEGIHFANVNLKWNPSDTNFVLKNVNFKAAPGELVGVIGTAGSGKSTLLEVILKEITTAKGKVEVGGTLSYASQEPWIFSSSIRQNILFGENYDLNKYLEVVKVCALQRDMTLFPYGDQTLVGDRGVMLSGGQKARINLARAIYKDADIYLLDDPLSAVDAHVARHIFEECVLGYLKDKCVVLATHQIHHLQRADKIYQIESGEIIKCGKYDEVIGLTKHLIAVKSQNTATETISWNKCDIQSETREDRTSGTVDKKVYKSYALAAGHWSFTCIIILLFIISQGFVNLEDCFVTFWINLEEKTLEDSQENSFFTRSNCLYMYTALTIGAVLITHIASIIFTEYCMRASKTLHDNMLLKIIYATMTFFNRHSCGRILNRFSKDLGTIDELLPMNLMNGITVATVVVAVIVMIIVSNYWLILPTILLFIVVIVFAIAFQPTNNNIKRTEAITKSAIFAHVAASIQGLTIIRTYGTQKTLIQEFDTLQDFNNSAFYLYLATYGAFGFWIDFITVVYTSLVIFSFFLLGPGVNSGYVGLAISSSFNLISVIQYGVKTFSEIDSQMTSVERIKGYAELDRELDDGANIPTATWPISGNILFKSVSLKYLHDEPPVLNNISFEVKSGEKIGVIGRTGAGKSSIISVFFRLFSFEGQIIIDGVDITSIPLNILRSRISIIPQEPVLFLGTLRKNLDPFNEFSDNQLWNALEELELKSTICNLPLGLETIVLEKGANFSVGQRQLLCLVRAILKDNKIIVLDEATANVDLRTDELIQSTIRNKFGNCTVLTIAHRLNTVIDSDKILALDSGFVVEFDHPFRLLQNTEGYFYKYVKYNGDALLKEFIDIAETNFHMKERA